jgi:hypothetical protein
VYYATFSKSYLSDNELEGKEGWLKTSPKETKQTSLIMKGYCSVWKKKSVIKQMRII